MKLCPCNTHVTRPGRIIALLVGQCGLLMPTAVAFPRVGLVRSIRTRIARPQLWPAVKNASGRCMVTTGWQSMLSKQDLDAVSVQGGVDSTLTTAALPISTLETRVSSPQEMEEIGAFFGADSRGGDAVLLRGCVTVGDVLMFDLSLTSGMKKSSRAPGFVPNVPTDSYGFTSAGIWVQGRRVSRGGSFEQESAILALL